MTTEELICGICQEETIVEIGELDSCFHRFCYPCISKWSEIESKCPFCKVRFTRVTRKRLLSPSKAARTAPGQPLPGEVLQTDVIPERNQRVVFEDPTFQEWIEGLGCIVCGGSQDEDQLLLCDGACAGPTSPPDSLHPLFCFSKLHFCLTLLCRV